MSVSWTYDTLKQALQDWVEDDNTEFLDQIDTIIGLGETKVARDLNIEVLRQIKTGQFQIGKPEVAKPAGYLSLGSLHYEGYDGDHVYLTQRSYDWVMDYNRGDFDYGEPIYFAELNEDEWLVAPVPEANFKFEARCLVRPTGLSASNTTSWLGDNVPDALLYACLIHTEQYLKDDERVVEWRKSYEQDVLPAARDELRNLLNNEYSPQTSVEGRA